DGGLLTGTTWAGQVAGTVGRTFDANFRVASESVNGGSAVTFQYDRDGLLTAAGALTLARDAASGRLTRTTLGGLTDTRTYDPFGQASGYSASANGGALLATQYTRDNLGRITRKVETVQGVTRTTDYAYDAAGRLEEVREDGVVVARYAYDANGN